MGEQVQNIMLAIAAITAILCFSGWGIIAAFFAKRVNAMNEELHKIAIALAQIATNSVHSDRDLEEAKQGLRATENNLRELNNRVFRLEKNA